MLLALAVVDELVEQTLRQSLGGELLGLDVVRRLVGVLLVRLDCLPHPDGVGLAVAFVARRAVEVLGVQVHVELGAEDLDDPGHGETLGDHDQTIEAGLALGDRDLTEVDVEGSLQEPTPTVELTCGVHGDIERVPVLEERLDVVPAEGAVTDLTEQVGELRSRYGRPLHDHFLDGHDGVLSASLSRSFCLVYNQTASARLLWLVFTSAGIVA